VEVEANSGDKASYRVKSAATVSMQTPCLVARMFGARGNSPLLGYREARGHASCRRGIAVVSGASPATRHGRFGLAAR